MPLPEPPAESGAERRRPARWTIGPILSQKLHAQYEEAVDRTFDPVKRTSALLDPYVREIAVDGDSPAEIAFTVARHTEEGDSNRDPEWMNRQMNAFAQRGILGRSAQWSDAFRNQTGMNVNYAINGVAKMLAAMNGE